jgi:hypothetical protein
MELEFFAALSSTLSSFGSISAILAMFGLGMLASVFISKRTEWFLPKPVDSRLCDYLPFERLLPDNKTILCSNGSLVRVFKVRGAQVAFARA